MLTITSAARAIGVSRGHVHEMARRGEIGLEKIGGRACVPRSEIEAFQARLESEAEASRAALAAGLARGTAE